MAAGHRRQHHSRLLAYDLHRQLPYPAPTARNANMPFHPVHRNKLKIITSLHILQNVKIISPKSLLLICKSRRGKRRKNSGIEQAAVKSRHEQEFPPDPVPLVSRTLNQSYLQTRDQSKVRQQARPTLKSKSKSKSRSKLTLKPKLGQRR